MNTLVKTYPKRFNSVFDSFFNDSFGFNSENNFTPSADIFETDNEFKIELAVPGISKEELALDIKDRKLIISGERKTKNEESGEKTRRLESTFGKFKRAFIIPESVKSEEIKARHENGILVVSLPKEEPKKLETKIEIS